MPDDRGGAWSSESSLSADSRQRVGVFVLGEVHTAESAPSGTSWLRPKDRDAEFRGHHT